MNPFDSVLIVDHSKTTVNHDVQARRLRDDVNVKDMPQEEVVKEEQKETAKELDIDDYVKITTNANTHSKDMHKS